ncbi:hypothetical protein SNE40_005142 [Patella caerulea]|uniref:Hydroxylysine kinase n=1 Tax=Patella caerulea TaxID=87958 RepID=A0AAN8Q1W1_PATCE
MDSEKAGSMIQKAGEVIKPVVPDGTVEELLEGVYGLKVLTVKSINGYDDCNYAITVDGNYDNKYIKQLWPHGYILKIINTLDSKRPKMHEAQFLLMDHLRKGGIPTQKPVPDKNGELMSCQKIYKNEDQNGNVGDCNQHIVKLLTYLPGDILLNYPFTTNLLYENGQFVAKVTNAFQGFQNGFFKTFDCRWSLGNMPLLKDYVFVLKPEDRQLVNKVIEAFENEINPANFPKGYIHGDMNESNILVAPEEGQGDLPTECKRYKFTGVIDFQHTAYSCFVYNLAVNVTYVMIFTDRINQLDVPGHILAGYLSLRQLTDEEFGSLKVLLAVRMCQSLVFGAHTYHLDPTNASALHTSKRGWSLLYKFWSEPKDKLESRWKSIIKSYQL